METQAIWKLASKIACVFILIGRKPTPRAGDAWHNDRESAKAGHRLIAKRLTDAARYREEG